MKTMIKSPVQAEKALMWRPSIPLAVNWKVIKKMAKQAPRFQLKVVIREAKVVIGWLLKPEERERCDHIRYQSVTVTEEKFNIDKSW